MPVKVCFACRQKFEPKSGLYWERYCSHRCRWRAKTARHRAKKANASPRPKK